MYSEADCSLLCAQGDQGRGPVLRRRRRGRGSNAGAARRGVHPDEEDELGETALLRAAHFGYVGIVQALFDNGANPNTKSKVCVSSCRPSCAAYAGQRTRHHLLQTETTALSRARSTGRDAIEQALPAAGAKE